MVKWRIKRGDKIAGEVPSSKVRQLAAAGKLRKTDLLCKEGTEKWVPAGNVKGLWQTNSPSQSKAVPKPQAPAAPSPATADNAAQTVTPETKVVRQETPPQQEAVDAVPPQVPSEPLPQQEAVAEIPQQEAVETLPQQAAIVTPPQPAPTEAPDQQEDTETLPQQEAVETHPQQEAFTNNEQSEEEFADPDVETYAEPDDEYYEESYQEEEYVEKAPRRRKWLVPLIVGCVSTASC